MAETKLSTHTNEALFLRDKNLVEDVMGNMSFTDAMFYHIMGVAPSAGQRAILDAVLVTLMEHGFTPSAIGARMTYLTAPEAMQSAVAAQGPKRNNSNRRDRSSSVPERGRACFRHRDGLWGHWLHLRQTLPAIQGGRRGRPSHRA